MLGVHTHTGHAHSLYLDQPSTERSSYSSRLSLDRVSALQDRRTAALSSKYADQATRSYSLSNQSGMYRRILWHGSVAALSWV